MCVLWQEEKERKIMRGNLPFTCERDRIVKET
jgi:hypothetical protein